MVRKSPVGPSGFGEVGRRVIYVEGTAEHCQINLRELWSKLIALGLY